MRLFSVNIDKLIKMTPDEAKSYADAADAILGKSEQGSKTLAVIGKGISSFKLASAFMEKGKRILFIDADVHEDIFLSKYRLGKNLKGFTDYLQNDESTESLVCVTNRERLDIVFTGDVAHISLGDIASEKVNNMFDTYKEEYDFIIVQSDLEGTVASCCDSTVIIMEQADYSEAAAQEKTKVLDQKGCLVLGVIIDE